MVKVRNSLALSGVLDTSEQLPKVQIKLTISSAQPDPEMQAMDLVQAVCVAPCRSALMHDSVFPQPPSTISYVLPSPHGNEASELSAMCASLPAFH